MQSLALAIVGLPLLGFLLAGLTVRVITPRLAQLVTCIPIIIAAICSAMLFWQVTQNDTTIHIQLFPWITLGDYTAHWAVYVDALTAVMLVVVTSVSAVVHVYSVGYMSHDAHPQRFMAYLSLFTFCMLMLVTGDNFLQLFLGWEGVGLASYLLIGFWFHKDSANAAAMKAFIVNRVGDFGLVLGMLVLFMSIGSLDYADVFAKAPTLHDETTRFLGQDVPLLTLACLLLFVGCMGKSAQFGLHTWLPDAMEGPTPVSALIHAATMVTAGVFLIARASPLFELSQDALVVVTIIGAITALFAATVGMVQTDIKRVIAYSTCSQLGYMFFACGVGAYGAAIFHLMTHAFFKALLFLGAGSVIHGMSDEQDMLRMGGIWNKMKITYAFMWIGSLALIGLPPLAGYYSKDIILQSAFAVQTGAGEFAFYLGLFAALLTAFYSFRLIFLTFHGQSRATKEVQEHVHESPAIMWVPLVLLAAGSIAAGWVGVHYFGMLNADDQFWNGALVVASISGALEKAADHPVAWWVTKLPLVLALAAAYMVYLKKPQLAGELRQAFHPFHRFLLNKWYVDELYQAIIVRPTLALAQWFWRFWDARLIDGLGPNGLAALAQFTGGRLIRLQTGYIYHYAFVMIAALFGLLAWLVILPSF